jgi:serine O-acetyltransferase
MILGEREIGDDVVIRQNTTMGIRDMSNLAGKPRIGNGVNIGAGAVIVGDIEIGRYSVIGPNVVVDENVPPFSSVRSPKPLLLSIQEASESTRSPSPEEAKLS